MIQIAVTWIIRVILAVFIIFYLGEIWALRKEFNLMYASVFLIIIVVSIFFILYETILISLWIARSILIAIAIWAYFAVSYSMRANEFCEYAFHIGIITFICVALEFILSFCLV